MAATRQMMGRRMRTGHLRIVAAGSHADDPKAAAETRGESKGQKSDELPYTVELWKDNDAIEMMLGALRVPSLAWSSYYAAVAAFPGRKITLRLNAQILANSLFSK